MALSSSARCPTCEHVFSVSPADASATSTWCPRCSEAVQLRPAPPPPFRSVLCPSCGTAVSYERDEVGESKCCEECGELLALPKPDTARPTARPRTEQQLNLAAAVDAAAPKQSGGRRWVVLLLLIVVALLGVAVFLLLGQRSENQKAPVRIFVADAQRCLVALTGQLRDAPMLRRELSRSADRVPKSNPWYMEVLMINAQIATAGIHAERGQWQLINASEISNAIDALRREVE
jgi:hypothetical protein